MKYLALALLTIAPSQVAALEETVLFENRNFTVAINYGDDSLFCDIVSRDRITGALFSLAAFDDGDTATMFIVPGVKLADSDKLIVETNLTVWTLHDMSAISIDEKSVMFLAVYPESENREFVRDLAASNVLYMDYRSGKRAATWSLIGSREALDHFVDCADRINSF